MIPEAYRNYGLSDHEKTLIREADQRTLMALRELTLEKLDSLQSGAAYGPSMVLGYSEQIHKITMGQLYARLEAINDTLKCFAGY